jgi:hypothetical protein
MLPHIRNSHHIGSLQFRRAPHFVRDARKTGGHCLRFFSDEHATIYLAPTQMTDYPAVIFRPRPSRSSPTPMVCSTRLNPLTALGNLSAAEDHQHTGCLRNSDESALDPAGWVGIPPQPKVGTPTAATKPFPTRQNLPAGYMQAVRPAHNLWPTQARPRSWSPPESWLNRCAPDTIILARRRPAHA